MALSKDGTLRLQTVSRVAHSRNTHLRVAGTYSRERDWQEFIGRIRKTTSAFSARDGDPAQSRAILIGRIQLSC